MDGDTLYSIGDLARRTGLSVKTIRFYSDQGIVPPTDRSPAGYRLYDLAALARLDLVRTLRDLGLDLPTIRGVVDRELSLPEVAAAHAAALETQIRTLRLRRAVLTAVARRGSTPEETELMHELARMSEAERHGLIDDFLAAAFGDLDTHPAFAGAKQSLTPELPDDPEPEQVEAWVELAELSRDPDFRAAIHRLAHLQAADQRATALQAPDQQASAFQTPDQQTPDRHTTHQQAPSRQTIDRRVAGPSVAARPRAVGVIRPDPAALARDQAAPALAAGIDPASPEADPYVTALIATSGTGGADLLARLEASNDPRRERYTRLLAVINGWQPPQSLTPALDWFTEALRARLPQGSARQPR